MLLLRGVTLSRIVRPSFAFKSEASKEEQNSKSEVKEEISEGEEKIKVLQDNYEKLETKFKETDDKYKRALAETENVRRRMNKQIQDSKIFGIQSFCKDLMEVSDTLTRASEMIPEKALIDKNDAQLKNLVEGVKMTDSQLLKVLEKHGLTRILPAVGDKFDPNYHEALFRATADGQHEDNTISACTKCGYKLHDRTLRPAYVGVFVK